MTVIDDIPGFDLAEDASLTPAAERILVAASRLFYAYGIRAVGVERIAKEARVIKKTIFDRFGSKDRLVAAYLRRRDILWRRRIREALARIDDDAPKAQLLAAFVVLEHGGADDYARGCAFVNAHAEITDPEHPGYRQIIEQKNWVKMLFTEIARRGAFREPELLGEQLMMLYEGATVLSSLRLFPSPIATARAQAETTIEANRDT